MLRDVKSNQPTLGVLHLPWERDRESTADLDRFVR